MTSHSLKAVNLNARLPTAQKARQNVKYIDLSDNQPVKLKQLLGACMYLALPTNLG